MGPSGQKTGAVRSGVRLRFPMDGADVFLRRATAILSVLRAQAVPILGDFAGDPVLGTKRGDDGAYQLRVAKAARVTAKNDEAHVDGRVYSMFLPCFHYYVRCVL